ncbi:MAG: aminotransferase class V-fold PLP-dependent enzyme [Rubricoccaceae bacterium]|nr:aminotransferase class V-fold PLP-dependent enzyme [Rubricoccaceae bacterium]
MLPSSIDLATLREQTLGVDAPVQTPFGERLLVYADFTASGRCLAFVEDYLREVAVRYANSHTEDSSTGHATTHLLHEAEGRIKALLNAGEAGKVIACGSGSTAAIHKLQEILGVAIPPATLHYLHTVLGDDALTAVRAQQPVVFVGPYEHHSNEVTWREGLCEVVEGELTPEGALDLGHLDRLLQDPRWEGRQKIGSFSAASNVTGLKSPVHEIARVLHRRGGLALFDYAAAAPYVPIDMNPAGDPDAALDAVFLSPHKFLGGPGSSGVLVFHERLYPTALPPSVGGGGTVVYVNQQRHAFIEDVEEREKAGTPGIFQTLRAALALEVKAALGIEAIQAREHELLQRALDRWGEDPALALLGPLDPRQRIGIVSFNVRCPEGRFLHPRLVTTLLNDLFGIQSRAGCSCAGPYAHRLLGIPADEAEALLALSQEGYHGVKPGWCRVGFHYTMDDAEAAYVTDAVSFVAEHGHRFLPLYRFRVRSGTWEHRDGRAEAPSFSLEAALRARPEPTARPESERRRRYHEALDEAAAVAERLTEQTSERAVLDGALGRHQYFAVAAGMLEEESADDAFCGGF